MNTVDILKWVGFFALLIGWGIMFAMDTLPTGWDTATLSVLGLLYGLPAVMKVGKAVMNKVSIK